MNYYNACRILVLSLLPFVYVFMHLYITKNITKNRVVAIVKQLISIILLNAALFYTYIFLQELIPLELDTSTITGLVVVYISVSLFWWHVATGITNKITDLIFKKLIFPMINKREKSTEILDDNPNSTIIIHFNDNNTFRNLSVERNLIPSDIKISVIGTNTYIDKNNKVWSQSVYACENISDEVRLKQIVYSIVIEMQQTEVEHMEANQKESV